MSEPNATPEPGSDGTETESSSDAATEQAGSAQLLEALGLPTDTTPERLNEILCETEAAHGVARPNRAARRAQRFNKGGARRQGSKRPNRRGRPEVTRDEIRQAGMIRAILQEAAEAETPEPYDGPTSDPGCEED